MITLNQKKTADPAGCETGPARMSPTTLLGLVHAKPTSKSPPLKGRGLHAVNGVGFLLALALLIPHLALGQAPDTIWTSTYSGNSAGNESGYSDEVSARPSAFASTFFDDFEDGNFSDWTILEGNWALDSPGAESSYCLSASGGKNTILAPFIGWVGTYEVDYKISGSGVSDFVIRILQTPATGESLTFYDVGLYPNGGDDRNRIGKSIKGEFTYLFQNSSSNDNLTDLNTWTHAKVERTSSGAINVYIDGTLNMSVIDTSISEPGYLLIKDYAYTSFDNLSYVYSPISSPGLVAYYPFNGNANDESGNGNDGTVNGATLVADRFGNASSAYSFDGVDDYIEVGNSESLSPTNELTIAVWANQRSSGTSNIVGKYRNNSLWDDSHWIGAINNKFGFSITGENNSVLNIESIEQIVNDNWYFLCGTLKNSILKFFVNGAMEDTLITEFSNLATSSLGLGIGDAYGGGQIPFSGLIDDIRIYNRALSEAEIEALYHEGGWDPVPPIIVSTSPAQNALNVAQAAAISVTFDQDMNAATLDANTFVVHGSQTGRLNGAYTLSSGDSIATFTPDSPFKVGEQVSVTLTTGVQSAAGDSLVNPFAWAFTVEVLGGSGEFATAVNYGVGTNPWSVSAADLDGDGDSDLAVANLYSDNVSVLLGNGDGTFQDKIDFEVGEYPQSVIYADLDGDGDLDLATANRNSDNVSVLLGNGDGTFLAQTVHAAGDGPWSVYAADLDGDGDLDLTTANSRSDNVSVLLNSGDGTFGSYTNYTAGDGPASIFSADLDGDGDLDLASINYASDNVSVLLGNGEGTFASQMTYSVGDEPWSVYASDLDGDGDLDLTTANHSTNTVSVLPNIGNGTFPNQYSYTAGDYPTYAFPADLDGDGDLDLAAANEESDNVSVLLNNGDGAFQTQTSYAAGDAPYSVFSADLDGDGDLDLVTTNHNSNTVSILLNTGGAPPTAGLVAHYPFNGNANDESGNANHGTVNGATLTTDRFGNANSAYSFDGVDDWINVANSTSLQLFDITVSVWVNTIADGVVNGVINQNKHGSSTEEDGNWRLLITDENAIRFDVYYPNSTNATHSTASGVYTSGNWSHIVATNDGITIRIYLNGATVLETTQNVRSGPVTDPIEIGRFRHNDVPSHYSPGDIDDIRIYNRALTASEIQALYHEGETVDITGPSITNISTTSNPSIGNNITVTANITDPQGLAAVDLHYARGGASAFTRTSMSFQGSDTELGAIPGSAVTEKGVAYFISAEDEAGNVSRSDTASIQVSFPSGTFTTSMSGGAFRTGFPKNQWRLISIPGDIDTRSVSSIIRAGLGSDASDETWNIFRYTGPGNDDYATASSFASGESYFLKQVVEESVHFTLGAGRSVDLTGWSLTLPARKWRFIAAPYPFAVSVAADQGTFKGPYAYGAFGSGGQEGWSTAQVQTTFQPWGGYIVYNNTDETQTLELKPAGLAKALLAKGTEELVDGWLLHLTAEGKRYFDAGNVIGRIEGASDDRDEFDSPEPPYLEGYISLALDRPDWSPNAGMSLFTSDVRALDETNGLWDLDLRTRGEAGPITITYNIQGEAPPGSQVVLLDLVQRRACDITAGEPPEAITNYSEQLPYRLKVIAGAPDYVRGAIEEALAQLPEEFALSQNYPNPFNPSTTIEYALPLPARVSLRIYNLLGREVAALVNDWQDMGYHEIVWQGRDQAGRSVASGVYFAVLHADGHILTRKMLLLK